MRAPRWSGTHALEWVLLIDLRRMPLSWCTRKRVKSAGVIRYEQSVKRATGHDAQWRLRTNFKKIVFWDNIECRMTILITYFSCLTARFFLQWDCSIRPLEPVFAYLWISSSLIRQNVGSLIRWFSSMHFHIDQEGFCPRCNHQKITRVFICRLTKHYMSYKALYDI